MKRMTLLSGWVAAGLLTGFALSDAAAEAKVRDNGGREPQAVGGNSSQGSHGAVSSAPEPRPAATSGSSGDDSSPVSSRGVSGSAGVSSGDSGAVQGDRGHHGSSSRHGRGRIHWGFGWDPYPYSWYWSAWGPSVYYSPGYARYRDDDGAGALDLDLAPEKAEVYVDGRLIGRADDFDGFPTYLWLPRGTYDVVFYLAGYKTIARQYTIYPGLVIDVDDLMQPGDSVRPEDMVSRSTEHRDDRLRRDAERQAAAGGSWRDRDRDYETWRERREAADAERERDAGRLDRSRSPSREMARDDDDQVALRVSVEPSDAAIYLDGKFVGEADDVAGDLSVAEGAHTLEAVRPGYRTTTRSFTAQAGDALTFDLRMERE
jgi:hypothetical protein